MISLKHFWKWIFFSVTFSFPLSYSGQPTVCSQNKCGSFISSCEREPETINSRTDYGVKHSVALCCYFKVRFTLLLIKASLALNDMYDIISNLSQNLLSQSSFFIITGENGKCSNSPWYSCKILDQTFPWGFSKHRSVDVSESSTETVISANHFDATWQHLTNNFFKNRLGFLLTLSNLRNLKLWKILKNKSAGEFIFIEVARQASG